MHDLFEGVCRYSVCEILVYFILKEKFYTLENFNFRKKMFEYGETEIGNKSIESKIYSRNVMCRKNISYSLSMKAALKFTTFLEENANGLSHNFELKRKTFHDIKSSEYFFILDNSKNNF